MYLNKVASNTTFNLRIKVRPQWESTAVLYVPHNQKYLNKLEYWGIILFYKTSFQCIFLQEGISC